MDFAPPVTRRLLLRRFAAGAPVYGTFLLPPLLHDALSRERRGEHRRHPPHGPAKSAPLIMLDPGHGGRDPGAIGVSGTYEKHVALATALELKRQLEASGRYRVALTRSRDMFVPLDGRVEAAERHGAALFVSMHADALADHSVRGASVYTLAQGASDAQTAALARRENSADRVPGAGHAHRHGHGHVPVISPDMRQILALLTLRRTRTHSVQLARDMVGSLDQHFPMLPNPERSAGFAVLTSADIPSILVEMGFMSNHRDEAALRRTDHRRQIAEAMHHAVDAYFAGLRELAGWEAGGARNG